MSKISTKKAKILAALLFITILIGLVIFLFSGDNFYLIKEIFNSNATKEEVQESISKLGIRAYIVVAVLAMLQVVFTFVPGEPLHVISGISFGLWKGVLVCLIGIMLGNTIIYFLQKVYGKRLTEYFASNVNFDFEAASSSNRLAFIVILLYVLPAIPYGIICFFAASVGIKYPKYILITGIGSIPSLLLDVGLGHVTMSTSWTVSIIVFIVIVVLLVLMCKYKTQIFNKINQYIKRSQEKEKNRVGKYNPLVYNVVTSALYGHIKSKVKIKLTNNVGKIRKPCILLCNHASFYDFIYAGKMVKRDKPHFVVARLYFHDRRLKFLLNCTGAFPKSMFANDIESTKNCLKVLSSGGVLAMMPEARLSTVGRFEDIQDTTYKFLQKMNVDTYTVKINGAYLANPKWGDKMRKGGKVEAELNQLFKAGELNDLSLEEIQDRVDSALRYNEWEWLDNHPEIQYRHKTIAEGLENMLCICPNCKNKSSLATTKDKIICENCGMEANLDNRYQLSGVEFKNIAEWYDWQTDIFRQEIMSNPDFALESNVELRHLSTDGRSMTRLAGNGTCRLDRTGLKYKGTKDGEEIEKFFPLDSLYRLLFGAGEDFEIYEGKEIYYFVPEDKRTAVMWYIVSCILKE